MSLYKELSPFFEYLRSVRKLKDYLSFDMQFPAKWSIPKSVAEDGQVVAFETEDSNQRGISFVSSFDEVAVSNTTIKIAKIIKLNKEKEIKERLFKQTIEHLKETFEKTDLNKLKTLYFDFEVEDTTLDINDELSGENNVELVGEGKNEGSEDSREQ